jgi:hypothetical protein
LLRVIFLETLQYHVLQGLSTGLTLDEILQTCPDKSPSVRVENLETARNWCLTWSNAGILRPPLVLELGAVRDQGASELSHL